MNQEYKLVRHGFPKKGEQFISAYFSGDPRTASCNYGAREGMRWIVTPIEPDEKVLAVVEAAKAVVAHSSQPNYLVTADKYLLKGQARQMLVNALEALEPEPEERFFAQHLAVVERLDKTDEGTQKVRRFKCWRPK